MSEGEDALRAAVAGFWARFRDVMYDRLHTIERGLDSARDGPLADATREAMRGEAHKLAGALGSVGVAGGTDHARAIEEALGEGVEPVDLRAVRASAAALRAEMEARDRA